jgi:oligopeptide/dipeptide ABC transporter ATP-binding protein
MEPLLKIEGLSVSFETDDGVVRAVDDVSFEVEQGEALGLVGESGCGKSVTCMSILRLIPSPPGRIDAGRILFRGRDLLTLSMADLRQVRGKSIGMIFQEPMTALSPLHRVGKQLAETLRTHSPLSGAEARRAGLAWLKKVGIPDASERMHAYPHELSGGMRQRVMIAMALMQDPEFLIADEPTTALDVTIQAQIFDLMREMKKRDTSLLLITHDMGVVWEMCTRVVVMYASQIAEVGSVSEIFRAPLHPYTQGLLASIPARSKDQPRLPSIPGQVPSPLRYPHGCRFRDRCPYAFDRCAREAPPLYAAEGRQARCFLVDPARTEPLPEGYGRQIASRMKGRTQIPGAQDS